MATNSDDSSTFNLGDTNTEIHKVAVKPPTDAGLVLKVAKCQFLQTEVDFLGHHISVNGIEPLKERIKVIEDFKLPETVMDLRRYLGVINFYHRFIPNAGENQAVLNNYLKGKKTVPGKDNIIADALSRIDELHLQPTIDYEGIAKAQEMDEELKEILSSHNSSLKLEKVPIFGTNFDIFCDCSEKEEDTLYSRSIPENCVQQYP
ncbi:uncharacterized protein K02A2.6 [Trichonephila inaurata madagascariensis]|uniref:Uncharacterized protein K02A2.6 n=1 Tax=Trichonephila inaurata madagascariensis TaxID=2747483 RepID=A0A8X7CIJ0_9ARAC|nr:uncharacterized protein K02A2.6 [Trichonephila inaurata madagascariensis]